MEVVGRWEVTSPRHEGAGKLHSSQAASDRNKLWRDASDSRASPHTRQDQCQEEFDSQLLCFGHRLHGPQASPQPNVWSHLIVYMQMFGEGKFLSWHLNFSRSAGAGVTLAHQQPH